MVNARETTPIRDRILIVESDPSISDLIGRQALQSLGYQIQVATDASVGISKAVQWAPDLILVDLNLSGLSGKDFLVALSAQGVQTPVIIISPRGMEADIIQTFRLGAADYLMLPAREAEVVNAVNRVLKQVHDRREREHLSQQLQVANQDLQSRVRELTTIFTLGKAMTSVTDQSDLMVKILEGAMRVTQSDVGWFLLREDVNKPFLVVAQHNLPDSLGVRLNQPWDDGISSLVAMSGELLTIHGEPIKRFKISTLGLSALIVPIKSQKKVIGLLVTMRKQPQPFGTSEQHLLEAMADYASISLVNARLFRTVEDRARALAQAADAAQLGEKVNNDILRVVKKEFSTPTASSLALLDQLSKDPTARWRPDQRQLLTSIQDHLLYIRQTIEAISQAPKATAERGLCNLPELVNQSLRRMQPHANRAGLVFLPELPSEAMPVSVDAALMAQALDGMLSDAIRNCGAGGQVFVRMERMPDGQAHLTVRSSRLLEPKEAEKVFDEKDPTSPTGRFGGLGIRLGLVREIVSRFGGSVWLEGHPGKGSTLHLTLPQALLPKASSSNTPQPAAR
jgi:DNA-binding response OmpR family regulator/signal transduction histidine kinase